MVIGDRLCGGYDDGGADYDGEHYHASTSAVPTILLFIITYYYIYYLRSTYGAPRCTWVGTSYGNISTVRVAGAVSTTVQYPTYAYIIPAAVRRTARVITHGAPPSIARGYACLLYTSPSPRD